MKYKVYHRINPTFQPEYPVDFPNGYEMVAEVVTEGGLEDVFRVTNHIDKEWWKNPEVKVHRERRSTSVGDIVEDETGKKFLCDLAGWVDLKLINFVVLQRLVGFFIKDAPKFQGDLQLAVSIGQAMANLESQLKEMK